MFLHHDYNHHVYAFRGVNATLWGVIGSFLSFSPVVIFAFWIHYWGVDYIRSTQNGSDSWLWNYIGFTANVSDFGCMIILYRLPWWVNHSSTTSSTLPIIISRSKVSRCASCVETVRCMNNRTLLMYGVAGANRPIFVESDAYFYNLDDPKL